MPKNPLSKITAQKHAKVLMQQGRVPLDSDFNEKNDREKQQPEKVEMDLQVKAFIREVHKQLAGKIAGNRKSSKNFRALFYGPANTGKTTTAHLIAKQLNKELYTVDLSKVVSKYIGETEKNLEALFARAEEKGWILFFDEADALFGKRTTIRDSHDKYANQEVSYLLQKILQQDGLVIISSNSTDMEKSVPAKFDRVIRFPLPTA